METPTPQSQWSRYALTMNPSTSPARPSSDPVWVEDHAESIPSQDVPYFCPTIRNKQLRNVLERNGWADSPVSPCLGRQVPTRRALNLNTEDDSENIDPAIVHLIKNATKANVGSPGGSRFRGSDAIRKNASAGSLPSPCLGRQGPERRSLSLNTEEGSENIIPAIIRSSKKVTKANVGSSGGSRFRGARKKDELNMTKSPRILNIKGNKIKNLSIVIVRL